MADAVNDTRMSDSQPQPETGSSFTTGLPRFERDLKSLQSAAATLFEDGRILIDQVKAIKTNIAAPHDCEADARLRDASIRIDEIGDFLHCVMLAAFQVEDQGDSKGLTAVLGQIQMDMYKLSEELISGAQIGP